MNPNKQTAPQQTPPDPQVAPAPNQKTEYVITQKSLNGLGGWLLFFLVVFALMGIGEITTFFQLLDSGVKNTTDTIMVVFAPLLAISLLTSVVLMAMRKKLALVAVYTAVALLALDSIMIQLVVTSGKGSSLALKISGAITSVIFCGLLALYFRQSRRVKETLVK